MQDCAPKEILTDFGCVPSNPVGFVEKFYGIGLSFIGMAALIFIIVGGYYIMTSQGDPSKLQKGRGYIMYSIIGVLLAVFGFVFLQVVTGDILKIPGFN